MFLRVTFSALLLVGAVFLTRTAAESVQNVKDANLREANKEGHATTDTESQPEASATHQSRQLENSKTTFEMLRDFESGERTSDSLQKQISDIAGDTEAVPWAAQLIDHPYRLSMVLSHVQNLDNNFEVLMIHTLSVEGSPEDLVTQYTSRISEADQKNILGSIVVAHQLQKKAGQPHFVPKSKQQYSFALKAQNLSNSFSLRKPDGVVKFTEIPSQSFDPLALLNENSGAYQEIENGLFEVPINGQTYLVSVTPRKTDIDTITIEIEMREKNSLVTETFILVYE